MPGSGRRIAVVLLNMGGPDSLEMVEPFLFNLLRDRELVPLPLGWLWQRALSRRSQNGRVSWDRTGRLIQAWLPPVRVHHPYPLRRMGVIT